MACLALVSEKINKTDYMLELFLLGKFFEDMLTGLPKRKEKHI